MPPKPLFFFILFFLIITSLGSINVEASTIDFNKDLIIIDRQGELTCKDNNCLIDGDIFSIINNQEIIRIDYYHKDLKDNLTAYVYNDKYVHSPLIMLPVKNNHILTVKDIEGNIIYSVNVFENNFDNFLTYGGGRFLNNPSIMIIPATIFSVLIVMTYMLYYNKRII